jgi:short-subunit dehydrogenase
VPLQLDVTKDADIQNAARSADDISILVNNAGVAFFEGLTAEPAYEHARAEMEVNYFGPLKMIRSFAPILKKNGGGAIITVSSIGGHVIFPGVATYCASKFAAHALILAARMELARQGTHVLGVYPGPVDTDMAKGVEMEKVTPEHVALLTLEALQKGQEDLYPDPYAEQIHDMVVKDPKAAEKAMRESYEQTANAA